MAVAPDDRVTFVAIDGVDGAGKTTFRDELAVQLEGAGRAVVRASVDSFHRPRAERYARGRDSPEGFYRDSYGYGALREVLLKPLRTGGEFRRAVFDVDSDMLVRAPAERAEPGAILVFDGIFLHRPELREWWDFSVWLEVPWAKNHHLPKHPEWLANRPRYEEGQRLYIQECDPAARASMVIDNTNLADPVIVRAPV